ncbi:MAG: choice-of-anchor Q domain-containing protein [Candidatus Binatia bacterium]
MGDTGGGIDNEGTLTVTSTFSGNSASAGWQGLGFGGGIFNDAGSTLTVTNSTFSGNSALGFGSLEDRSPGGGGIVNSGGTLTVTNTIVANSPSGGNCSGPITDGGHNIDDDGSCGFSGTSPSNTNPMLSGLANNGGPTQTIALLAGSPAIDAGDESVCSVAPVNNLDQRGYVRPGTGSVNCSIGAYEYNAVPASLSPTPTPTNTPLPANSCCEYASQSACGAPVNGQCQPGGTPVLNAACTSTGSCATVTPTQMPTATDTPANTPTNTSLPANSCCEYASLSACGAPVNGQCQPGGTPVLNAACTSTGSCATVTPTQMPTATDTPTNTPTHPPTKTVSPTPTSTPSSIATPSQTATTTSTPTFTATAAPSASATATLISTGTATPKLTSTATPPPCVGDCNGDTQVTVNEIIVLVNIALGSAEPAACAAGIPSGSQVNVALIIQAVNNALNGCVQNL